MGQIRRISIVRPKRTRERVAALETQMAVRFRGENELNRRIDSLVALVTELDKSLDSIRDKRNK
jgi:hypothetical protein